MKATGRPSWLREADMATSEASHSTTKGMSSLIGWRTTSPSCDLIELKALIADSFRGKVSVSNNGLILSEY